MRESSKSTAETRTALAPGASAASRSASVSTGLARSRTTSIPSSPRRPSWRRSVWNSPSVETSFGRSRIGSAERKRSTRSCVLAANGPEVGEERLVQGRPQVLRAVATGARLRPDRPLDHLHVVVAPLHEPLVEVDEALGDLGRLAVVAIRAEQGCLDPFRLLNR